MKKETCVPSRESSPDELKGWERTGSAHSSRERIRSARLSLVWWCVSLKERRAHRRGKCEGKTKPPATGLAPAADVCRGETLSSQEV